MSRSAAASRQLAASEWQQRKRAADVCLDVDGKSPTTRVETVACNDDFHGGLNEQWDFDQATGIVSSRLFGSETSCMMAC